MQKQLFIHLFKFVLTPSVISLLMMGGLTRFAMDSAPPKAIAQEKFNNELIDSIRSVEQVKQDLRLLFQEREQCKVGSCWNMMSTRICETVAALDLQVNGQIVGGMTSVGSEGNIPISAEDLALMKLIFSQCKPTNYQYWNWPMLLHVVYSPSAEVDQEIRRRLGL